MTDLQRNLAIGVGVAILLLGGIYWWARGDKPVVPTQSSGGNIDVRGTGEFTVEQINMEPPALGEVHITTQLSPEAQALLRAKIEEQYTVLRGDPKRVDAWLQLGVYRKIGGDYEGSIEAWEYVAAAAPLSLVATARGNLGDLYLNFIHDFAKAKQNLSAAIQANPKNIDYYRNLVYLENTINKDPAAARAVVEAGLTANPGNADLLALKATLTK